MSSFPTIRATLLHIWYGETGWLSRLNGKGWKTSKVTGFPSSTKSTQVDYIEWVREKVRVGLV